MYCQISYHKTLNIFANTQFQFYGFNSTWRKDIFKINSAFGLEVCSKNFILRVYFPKWWEKRQLLQENAQIVKAIVYQRGNNTLQHLSTKFKNIPRIVAKLTKILYWTGNYVTEWQFYKLCYRQEDIVTGHFMTARKAKVLKMIIIKSKTICFLLKMVRVFRKHL